MCETVSGGYSVSALPHVSPGHLADACKPFLPPGRLLWMPGFIYPQRHSLECPGSAWVTWQPL